MKSLFEKVNEMRTIWNELKPLWSAYGFENNPLQAASQAVGRMEKRLSDHITNLLNCDSDEANYLYEYTRKVKAFYGKEKVCSRAAIHVTNVCRANCKCCPMRRDNSLKQTACRVTAIELFEAIQKAAASGYRDIFIQGGEDAAIIPIVSEAITKISEKYSDIEFTLNLGNLSKEQLKALYRAGARKYAMKHETANPGLHQTLRQDTLQNRVRGILKAKKTGFTIGSGNIVGLPKQNDQDLVNDIIFFGRLGTRDMVSSTPYIPSESLPDQFRRQPSADWEKFKRFIAILRLLFPEAHIHAPSNADSTKILRQNLQISGQAELILSGADEISVEFTPARIAEHYSLYEQAGNRHIVDLEKEKVIQNELG